MEVSEENEKKVVKTKDGRIRNYATIVYPDSAPDNWQEILADLRIPALVSPLHDKDVNPDGVLKKPHYHVLMCTEGKKTREQFREMASSFGGVGSEIVQSIRGYSRYLCHLDNPEKAQYSVTDIKSFGGADFEAYVTLPSDLSKQVKLMQRFCVSHNVRSFSFFANLCAEDFPDWHYILLFKCTNYFKAYFSSARYDWENQMKR